MKKSVGISIGIVFGIFAGFGVYLLSQGHSFEEVKKNKCTNNLSQIYKACAIYADIPENKGKFPDQIEDLSEFFTDNSVLVCPSAKPSESTSDNQPRCDYVLVSSKKPSSILAYCNCEAHSKEFRIAVDIEGRVQFFDDLEKFQKLLEKAPSKETASSDEVNL